MATRKLTAPRSSRQPAAEGKDIVYNPESGDYSGFYDGNLIIVKQYRSQVAEQLNAHVAELLYDTAIAVADDEACYELEHSAVGAVSLTTDSRGASLCIGNKLVSLSLSELRALRQVLNTPGTKL